MFSFDLPRMFAVACSQEIRDRLRPLVHDTVTYLHGVLTDRSTKTIVVEGAQSTMLDIDFGLCCCSCPVNLFRNI